MCVFVLMEVRFTTLNSTTDFLGAIRPIIFIQSAYNSHNLQYIA